MHRVAKPPIPMAVPALLSALSVALLYAGHGYFGLVAMGVGTWWGLAPFVFRLDVSLAAAQHQVPFRSADDATRWHNERFLPALEVAMVDHWLMGPLLVRTDEEASSLRGRFLGAISWTNWGMAVWPLWASAIDKAVRATVGKSLKDGANKYEAYAELLKKRGMDDEEIFADIERHIEEDKKLDARICPKCGGPLERKVDERMAGPGRADDQVWINYRCPCGFLLDRAE